MNLADLISTSDSDAFPSFETKNLRSSSLILLNRTICDLAEEELIDECAWIVPSAFDDESTIDPLLSRQPISERYGGVGIGPHPGGVRCGLSGWNAPRSFGHRLTLRLMMPRDA
jgi:hypothetical protein